MERARTRSFLHSQEGVAQRKKWGTLGGNHESHHSISRPVALWICEPSRPVSEGATMSPNVTHRKEDP